MKYPTDKYFLFFKFNKCETFAGVLNNTYIKLYSEIFDSNLDTSGNKICLTNSIEYYVNRCLKR